MGFRRGCPICEHHMGHHGMGGMMMGRKRGMIGMLLKPWKMMMIAEKLGLSDDQTKKIRDIFMNMRKQKIQTKCEIKLKRVDLWNALMQENPDMQDVESRIREIANLKANKKIGWIKAMQDAKNVLTDDQRKKAKEMIKSWWMKCGMSGGEEYGEEEEGEEEEEGGESEEESEEG